MTPRRKVVHHSITVGKACETRIRQINLAVVPDGGKHLPLTSRVPDGSMGTRRCRWTMEAFEAYGTGPEGAVMNRGFWGGERLRGLHAKRIRVWIPVPSQVRWARELIGRKRSEVSVRDSHGEADGRGGVQLHGTCPPGGGRGHMSATHLTPRRPRRRHSSKRTCIAGALSRKRAPAAGLTRSLSAGPELFRPLPPDSILRWIPLVFSQVLAVIGRSRKFEFL